MNQPFAQHDAEALRHVVEEVLTRLSVESAPSMPVSHVGEWGVFGDVDNAVAAARTAFEELTRAGYAARREIERIIKKICVEQADELGRMEFEETKIGRIDHKIAKLQIQEIIPGVDSLKPLAHNGDGGLTTIDQAPFGVIGAIAPVTHSLPTIACNAITMIAAGNTVVFNPHPAGRNVACEGVRRFNKAIYEATGLINVITIIGEPTIESAQQIFQHRDVRLLVVTGGPAVARAALKSNKRAIVAGPGNPPVLVDETADLDQAARSIVTGAGYDNNLLCIGEKEIFAVHSIADQLMNSLSRHGGNLLNAEQVRQLTEIAFTASEKPDGKPVLNRELIGNSAQQLASLIGLSVPAETEILVGETEAEHPYVATEQMMPFVPVVRCRDAEEGIQLCRKYEHGYGHTAIIHSQNLKTIEKMARVMNTTLFIVNGPSVAGIGIGGEGPCSFSIATPTGEGVTVPATFTRQRRLTVSGGLRMIGAV
ncbi:aldehyde dehydrogenase family protein [Calycomorphotria hydatis]|uniref:Succinate-semialdehyde dehydrogenase (Acetylating) n=1 Tax=Calycomorphotria hydatis TaxID=2528027 RepID=A0A517T3E9_9PLAN|nr:aldehyde dehydrogenase family protein [Calycomorphotria hydatis]QDT62907.1 Succinate-semialdehyde dehydrogenase (acetylating) [Calycomorphotria hydatis]